MSRLQAPPGNYGAPGGYAGGTGPPASQYGAPPPGSYGAPPGNVPPPPGSYGAPPGNVPPPASYAPPPGAGPGGARPPPTAPGYGAPGGEYKFTTDKNKTEVTGS